MNGNLKKERLEIGRVIVEHNLDIFEKLNKIEEINAGFNNSIFSVNDKYIIKVCDNSENDNLFDIESNFYNKNKDSDLIPNLYRYDKSKKIVPYVYEIMERINGKSIYYYWYKWKEFERENFIKRLMNLLSNIHVFQNAKDDWCEKVKSEIIDNYNKCKDLFSEDENKIINKAFEFYDIILSDNHYSLIHNDLHFDNILLDENNNIKLIDFNDSIIAPFDYDLRILFMCKDRPWKWANAEMDPYQKPEDYKNIRNYILKYYDKLSQIKYLNERMYVYEILDDIRHLPEYKLKELIDNIVDKSKKILDTNN